jgi:hypothetical protein
MLQHWQYGLPLLFHLLGKLDGVHGCKGGGVPAKPDQKRRVPVFTSEV